jgi:hypothetical protein
LQNDFVLQFEIPLTLCFQRVRILMVFGFNFFHLFQLGDIPTILLLAKTEKHGFGNTVRISYTQPYLDKNPEFKY